MYSPLLMQAQMSFLLISKKWATWAAGGPASLVAVRHLLRGSKDVANRRNYRHGLKGGRERREKLLKKLMSEAVFPHLCDAD